MKNLKKIASLLIIALFMVGFMVQPAHAVGYKTYKLQNGGVWKYTNADTKVTKNWTAIQWRSKIPIESITFSSPKTTNIMFHDLVKSVGKDLSKKAIKYGVESAVSYGITAAKEKVKKKFGTKVASKVIPFLSAFSWSYTAFDIIQDIGTGQKLVALEKAVKKKTGLIYVKAPFSTGGFFLWDGSTQYGKYPYAKLGPNNWQIGKVKVY